MRWGIFRKVKVITPFSLGMLLVSLYWIPFLLTPAKSLPGYYPDAWVFLWNIDRFGSVLAGDESLYFTNRIFHPFGANLALHTQSEALSLIGALFVPYFGLTSTFSLLVYICFLLNYAGLSRMFFSLGVARWGNMFFSVLLTLHSHFIGHLAGGHLNFIAYFPVFFWLSSFFRLLQKGDGASQVGGRWKEYLLLVISVGAAGYINLYFLYFIALIGVCLGSLWWLLEPLRRWREIALVGGFSLLGIAFSGFPVVLAATAYRSADYVSDHLAASHSADLLFYLFPSPNQLVGSFWQFSDERLLQDLSSAELGCVLGFGVLCLLLVALVRPEIRKHELFWPIAGGAIFFLGISLGNTIRFSGVVLAMNPFIALRDILPFFPSVPIRFGFLSVIFIFSLVALALPRVPRSIAILLISLMLFEHLPVALPNSKLSSSTALIELRSMEAVFAVHDFGVGRQHKLLRQLEHRKRVTQAFHARAPRRPLRLLQRNKFIRSIRQGTEYEGKELQKALDALKIQALIVDRGQTIFSERILKTGLFTEAARDSLYLVFIKK